MARRSGRRGSRRARSGSATYARPSTESVSVLRLYARDFQGVLDFDSPDITQIVEAIGFSKPAKIRLLAVCFGGIPGYDASGNSAASANATVNLEFRGSGCDFALNQTSGRPARVRVPKSDIITGQWWNIGSDGSVTPTITGSLTATSSLYVVSGSITGQTTSQYVQFVDVAIHF